MAKPLKTYDARDLVIFVNGIPLGGFADGTFFTIERNVDTFDYLSGVDGEFVRFKGADRSGIITITLNQSSDSNSLLQSQHELDLISNTGAFGILVTHGFTGSSYSSPSAFVKTHPSAEYGKDSSNRSWQILCNPIDIREVGIGFNR